MIPEHYLNFIQNIHLSYWYIGTKLNKIYLNEFIDVIKFVDNIKEVLHKSNVIKIKYEVINNNNVSLINNSDIFIENIRILYNEEFIKLTTCFNTSVVYSKNHLNIYKDNNFKSYTNYTLNKMFLYLGIFQVFFICDNNSGSNKYSKPKKRTNIPIFCTIC